MRSLDPQTTTATPTMSLMQKTETQTTTIGFMVMSALYLDLYVGLALVER